MQLRFDCRYCRNGLEQGDTGRDMFIRTLDGLLAEILRVEIEGMADVGTCKFLIVRSGSRRGDKLLLLVCTMAPFPSKEVGNVSLVMPDLKLLFATRSLTKGCSIS